VSRNKAFLPKKDTLTGWVDNHNMDEHTFDDQYHTFTNFGYAANPDPVTGSVMVGLAAECIENKNATIFSMSKAESKQQKRKRKIYKRKRKREQEDVEDVENYVPQCWRKFHYSESEQKKYDKAQKENAEKWALEHPESESEEGLEEEDPEKKQQKVQEKLEKSEFHGEKEHDYMGRSYMWVSPEYRKKSNDRNFIPKRYMHTWKGHTKGVNSIKWFPETGHILLSASNDCTVKIWDVYGDKRCLRTMTGHTLGVRNIDFNPDGTKFLTTSYDKWIKCWDTEYGKVISRHTSGPQVFDGTFYPRNDNQFLCGQRNKRAVQWDMRSNRVVQSYYEHLSSVNCVTFIDNNRRFCTTSDDKKIFIWDYGIPVVIHHISEPNLQSCPFVAVHPNGKWFCGQSMDNKVKVYGAINKFKENKKKHFKGHLSAGYACQIDFSPDGRFMVSGDANGRAFFWDWKTSKIYRRMKCHDEVCLGVTWHPVMQSKVATCSWDGLIKLWD